MHQKLSFKNVAVYTATGFLENRLSLKIYCTGYSHDDHKEDISILRHWLGYSVPLPPQSEHAGVGFCIVRKREKSPFVTFGIWNRSGDLTPHFYNGVVLDQHFKVYAPMPTIHASDLKIIAWEREQFELYMLTKHTDADGYLAAVFPMETA